MRLTHQFNRDGYADKVTSYLPENKDRALPRSIQMVKLDNYPQLRLLCWSAPHISEISESDAFALYEREWRHVDQAQLTAHERELIEHLTRTLGRGVLLV